MFQQLSEKAGRLTRVALIALVFVLGSQVRAGWTTPQAAALQPALSHQVFNVNCVSVPSIGPTYSKLADLGTFTVYSPDSIVELTYNGRIYVSSFISGTGAVFELRVDDFPTSESRARANLRTAEAGGGGVPVSITGYFPGLVAGDHIASMWVRTSAGGAGNTTMLDHDCWSSDVLIVKEYTPFGFPFFRA